MNEQHIMYIDDLVSKPHDSFPVETDFLAVLDRYDHSTIMSQNFVQLKHWKSVKNAVC